MSNFQLSRSIMEVYQGCCVDPRVARIFVFPGARCQMWPKMTAGNRDLSAERSGLDAVHYASRRAVTCFRPGRRGCSDQDCCAAGGMDGRGRRGGSTISLNPPPCAA